MKANKIVLGVLCTALALGSLSAFAGCSWTLEPPPAGEVSGLKNGQVKRGLVGAYSGEFETISETDSAPLYGSKKLVSDEKDRFLLATAFKADASLYEKIGYEIAEGDAAAKKVESGTYYTGIELSEGNTVTLADLLHGEEATGLIVAEASLTLGVTYTVRPYLVDAEGGAVYGSSATFTVEEEPDVPDIPDVPVIRDYFFEFEDAEYLGVSGNDNSDYGHKCIANSFEFNAGFGGNVCVKNIPSKSVFTFTVESDKSGEATLELRFSNSVLMKDKTLADAFEITNNGENASDLSVEIPTEKGETPSGANGAYFSMVTVETTLTLKEGTNKIDVRLLVNGVNPDYMMVRTDATLTFEPMQWEEDASFLSVVAVPTETGTGTVTLTCSECETVAQKQLPAIKSGYYANRDTETERTYTLTVNGYELAVAKAYALTLQNATHSDGSEKDFVLAGSTPVLLYTAPEGTVLQYWYNAENESETFEVPFVMPAKALTLAPKFGANQIFTLTLKNAKFADDTESKQVMAGTRLSDLQVEIPEGRALIGWFDFETREILSDTTFFTMPEQDITVAPLFETTEYAPTNGSAYGKVQMFPYNDLGWIRNLNGTGYARVDMPNVDPDQLSWGEDIVGGEMGVAFTRTASTNANFFFTVISPFKVESAKKYMFTYTVCNLGTEEITLQIFQINSGTATSGTFATETVTLAAGETKTISLQTPATGFSNDNVMTLFKLLNATQGFKLGTYQYVSEA